MGGYRGVIARVDLSNRKMVEEKPSENFYRMYFGGTGFTTYFLLKETAKCIDPLSEKNKLIFSCGIMTGAPVAGAGRHNVGAKSPLTGALGDGQAGGEWGTELKRAGYDALIIEGKANKPVYIYVNNGNIEIKDASHLWGKAPHECQELIREELKDPKIKVTQIGTAGEKLVRYACIENDLHAFAGRTGLGAVMGSKMLKAIAVRGTQNVEIYDKNKLMEYSSWMAKNFKNFGFQFQLHNHGTSGGVEPLSEMSALPTKNFNLGSFEGAGKINGTVMTEKYVFKQEGCFACPIRCKRMVKIKGKPSLYSGPEYESVASLGSLCCVDDLEVIIQANELCDIYGLDTISTGVSIAFAMECFENGLLTNEDTGGLNLTFGNADALLQMIELIGERKGLGDILANGTLQAANEIGGKAKEYAMHVKGQELPMHEPRAKYALGLGYAVSPTGADHMHNIHDTSYTTDEGIADLKSFGVLNPLPFNDLGPEKVNLFNYAANWRHFENCAINCHFVNWSPLQLTGIISAITGWNTSVLELMNVAQRVVTLARCYTVREGFTADDDRLPERMFQAFTAGPIKGMAIRKEDFERAKRDYYQSMGWDRDTGIPEEFTLLKLNIGWAKVELE
jgi:aldehyde:ferredoxin oxidoreductase